MIIELSEIGKRFGKEWIFKNINYTISDADRLAVLGPNGSGKSTLLQIISGASTQSSGTIKFFKNDVLLDVDHVFKHLSIAAPYLELIEEMTLIEMLDFHFQFKKRWNDLSNTDLINILGLQTSSTKEIRNFSSGMKQRVKLMLAIMSDVDMILLDEPCSNLDKQGIDWYQDLLNKYLKDRILIVCSNQEHEYSMCSKSINVMDFKQGQKA